MISFLFFLALQPISRKTECRVNLRYVQVVYKQNCSLKAKGEDLDKISYGI